MQPLLASQQQETVKKMKSYCNLRSLLLLFISLSRTCTAQQTDSTELIVGICVPIAVIVITGSFIICTCVYSCYFRPSTPIAVQPHEQRPQNQWIYNIERESTSPYQTQAGHLNRQPPHSSTTIAPRSTNLNFPPIGGGPIVAHQQTSQTVPQATSVEPVSLPEATLHQGDAPPAYTEAIKMKTVIIVDGT